MNLLELRRRMTDYSPEDVVIHQEFGEGTIRCINSKIIEIEFAEETKQLHFEVLIQANLIEHKNSQ
ncbi:hypothetical protein [Aneurinibacillus aneurinilyticus]|jgi:hypothetical protein|uniref:hypothetical protein n=1 Tax=Aneurinibacillus aneurinilyticus TaxID=1391 RepID=UPI0023F755E0|nr:hypothetical protein [Aneurinibacillus aneurinilyticus]MCI1696457.1 hypothetical protein [Aneurinibacillus aneurinilyticus]